MVKHPHANLSDAAAAFLPVTCCLQSVSVSLARAVEAESQDPLFHLKHVMFDTVGNMVILIKSSLHFELLQFYKCNTLLSFKNINAL